LRKGGKFKDVLSETFINLILQQKREKTRGAEGWGEREEGDKREGNVEGKNTRAVPRSKGTKSNFERGRKKERGVVIPQRNYLSRGGKKKSRWWGPKRR